MLHKHEHEFYGMGTVGEKGQVVIPVKARDKFDVKSGDELIFFGLGPMLHIIKANQLDKMLDSITKKFNSEITDLKDKIKHSEK